MMTTLQIDHQCLLVVIALIEIHNVLSVLNLGVGFNYSTEPIAVILWGKIHLA